VVRVVSVVGARPQFIKAAVVSRAIRARHEEILVHTGQHYDDNMSAVFFAELRLASPDRHLEVGSGPHGRQTGQMLERLEAVMSEARPDVVLIYGDTNSTLAGALAAAKLGLPLAHVEAGLRSFDRRMPEEVNRVVADHLSDWVFCPTLTARRNLEREGIANGLVVGDVMLDLLLESVERLPPPETFLAALGVEPGGFYLATIHRAGNTDDGSRLQTIVEGLCALDRPAILPLHPRTRAALDRLGLLPLHSPGSLRLLEPLGYLEMLQLERHAAAIVTDSGGVQKEAYFLGVPCVTVRDQTEWVETIDDGWNVLVGADKDRLVAAARRPKPATPPRPHFGRGDAAMHIVRHLENGSV
jgi:UDP-N-acetylglucosamine 2-epimerase